MNNITKNTNKIRINTVVMFVIFSILYFIFKPSRVDIGNSIEIVLFFCVFWTLVVYIMRNFIPISDSINIINSYTVFCSIVLSIAFIYFLQYAMYCKDTSFIIDGSIIVINVLELPSNLKRCLNVHAIMTFFFTNTLLSLAILSMIEFVLTFLTPPIKTHDLAEDIIKKRKRIIIAILAFLTILSLMFSIAIAPYFTQELILDYRR